MIKATMKFSCDYYYDPMKLWNQIIYVTCLGLTIFTPNKRMDTNFEIIVIWMHFNLNKMAQTEFHAYFTKCQTNQTDQIIFSR